MGRRGPCEINLKDQQEDKEGPSQGRTNLRSGCWRLEESDAGKVRSSLAGEPAGQSGGRWRVKRLVWSDCVGTLRADLRMTGV